jgi:hypothetical protein
VKAEVDFRMEIPADENIENQWYSSGKKEVENPEGGKDE